MSEHQASTQTEQDGYWTTARIALVFVLGALVVAALSYGGAHLSADRVGPVHQPAVPAAKQGDCVGRTGDRAVDCGSDAAQFAVVQSFPGSTDRNQCADVPGSEFALVQRVTATTQGTVLCVEPLRVDPRWQGE
ncbi:LppU/SCO3897 family protein [Streptacidiphilus sp. PAMC 29251]